MRKTFWVEARIPVDIDIRESGLVFATSPLIKGMLVSEHSEKDALAKAVEAIESLGSAVAKIP